MYSVKFNGKNVKTTYFLGKEVEVIIDRPLGTKHLKWNFAYPVNYGYIENAISADGEELDAYVLGVNEPLEKFSGIVKAVICRLNDNEDKLVVMPKEKNYSNTEICTLTNFQEKYFKSNIIRCDDAF